MTDDLWRVRAGSRVLALRLVGLVALLGLFGSCWNRVAQRTYRRPCEGTIASRAVSHFSQNLALQQLEELSWNRRGIDTPVTGINANHKFLEATPVSFAIAKSVLLPARTDVSCVRSYARESGTNQQNHLAWFTQPVGPGWKLYIARSIAYWCLLSGH